MKHLLLLWFALIASAIYAQPSVDYQKITDVTAYAATSYSGRGIENVINGSGLAEDGSHGVSNSTMWSSQSGGATSHNVMFDLAVPQQVLGMHVWNGNWVNYTNRGIKDFDVYYSTSTDDLSGISFTSSKWTLLGSKALAEGSGVATYTGEYVDLAGLPNNVTWIGFYLTSNHGGDFAYAMLSEIEFYRPEGDIPCTAAISGDAYLISGGNASTTIQINYTGTPPFAATYTDGTSNYAITSDEYVTEIEVQPTATTTYTLVSVSDANGDGTTSGSATVDVVDGSDFYTKISNDKYEAAYNSISGMIELTELASGKMLSFTPSFYVARRTSAVTCSQATMTDNFNYKTVTVGGNSDYYAANAGYMFLMEATGCTLNEADNSITFTYPGGVGFTFSATLSMPTTEDGEPNFESKLGVTTANAYFSVGYYGAPSYDLSEVSEIFQPLPFTELRFPSMAYITPTYLTTVPTTLATVNGVTYGVVADASEFPFDPLPCSLTRSPFGVAIRDADGKVHPTVWGKIMCNTGSYMTTGTTYKFNYRLYVAEGDLSTAYEDIARRLYGFGDMRNNDLGSLNSAFENMVTFAMSQWGRYTESMKGYSYETDIANSVKNTSSLPIHGISFILDDSTMFVDRGVPITEFMLSRENFCYAEDETSSGSQTAYNSLGDPCMTALEMLSYYSVGDEHGTAFMDVANNNAISLTNLAHEKMWRQNLAYYKATGESSYLQDIISGADQYISDRITTKQTGFNYINHTSSSFWSALAPRFWELYETYKVTGYPRYLEAARYAARSYAYHLWLSPAVPDEDILCNINNLGPQYRSNGYTYSIAEEYAPAWRLSCIGLSCECGGTASSGHRGIFMANHAPYFIRIGALTGDTFLTEIGKAAIIGRWTSFPGYHINTDRSTAHEKEDFAHKETIEELVCATSMHYSHVWPMVALTFDYLVSDAFAKSMGEIDYPTLFIENTANLYNNIYFQPGTFYGEENTTLWMPMGLVSCDEQELNYIVARGNDKLYIAFVNQCGEEVTGNVTIDSELLSLVSNNAKVWRDNEESGSLSVSNNKFSVTVSANGITAIAIEEVDVETRYQDDMYFQSAKNEWESAYDKLSTAQARTMILGFSNEYTRVYAYSEAAVGELSSVQFQVYYDGVLHENDTQTTYPYEYGDWVPASVNTVKIVVTNSDATSEEITYVRMPYTLSAAISGWTSIKRGESAPISFTTDGQSPWVITYMCGDSLIVQSCGNSTYEELVSPESTTIYELISAVDAAGDVAEVANTRVKVSVADEYILLDNTKTVSQDSYVNALGTGNKYGTTSSFYVKGRAGSERIAYLDFDFTDEPLDGDVYMLGVWLPEAITSNIVLELTAGELAWDESTMTWSNLPSTDHFQVVDTVGISEISGGEMFHYFNVSEAVKSCTSDRLTFQIAYLQGDEDLGLLLYSKEKEDGIYAPHLLSDAAFVTGIGSVVSGDTSVMVAVVDQVLQVASAEPVTAITVYNTSGQQVASTQGNSAINLGTINSGVYVVAIALENSVVTKTLLVK